MCPEHLGRLFLFLYKWKHVCFHTTVLPHGNIQITWQRYVATLGGNTTPQRYAAALRPNATPTTLRHHDIMIWSDATAKRQVVTLRPNATLKCYVLTLCYTASSCATSQDPRRYVSILLSSLLPKAVGSKAQVYPQLRNVLCASLMLMSYHCYS